MKLVIMTSEELEQFKSELLRDIGKLISDASGIKTSDKKQWYKSSEVRTMLGISSGKLQQLRIDGVLRSSKVGGVHYYRHEDIDRMFNGNQHG